MLKKAEYPGKKLALRFWCWENDKAAMQVLLESGFGIPSVVVLLSYDLSGDLPAKKDIEGIAIGRHDCDEEGIKAYLKSNELGYDGVQDSEDELRFAMNDDSYRIFTACKEGDVLSACTVWRISDECWATENVFTVPDYRRMGLSRETIGEALRYLKAIGAKKSSLSVLGDNLNAIRLYLSLGFKLSLNILCFQLTVS